MQYQAVLKFWFEETDSQFHFNATPAFDAEIRNRFEEQAIEFAANTTQTPHAWEHQPDSLLALVILLDQFPRNMYRDTPAAFAWDQTALEIVHRSIDSGMDLKVPIERRAFIYMPLMHSENLKDQNLCVKICDQRLQDENTLFHAKAHRDIVQKFGRFPHRNSLIGRVSTDEEIQYMRDGGYSP